MQLWTAFVHTGWVGKAVLGILLLFSVLSWGTIFVVWRRFNRSQKASRRFVGIFRKAKRLADVQSASNALAPSALVGLFKAGYAEIEAQVAHDGAKYTVPTSGSIELIASKKATEADFAGNHVSLDLFPIDEFGARTIPLPLAQPATPADTSAKGE